MISTRIKSKLPHPRAAHAVPNASRAVGAALLLTIGSLSAAAQTNFALVTNAIPVLDVFDGAGAAFVDYDNDGYEDLFVANLSGPSRLYHNEGNGEFRAMLASPIATDFTLDAYGAAWGDYDNDGLVDLFLAAGGTSGGTNVLYHNKGGGSFERISVSPLTTVRRYSVGAAWTDFNRDGLLDLFVANDGRSHAESLLFQNHGDGTFITNATLNFKSDALTGAWADYNNDGWPDLAVSNGFFNDLQTNFLFLNSGAGQLVRLNPTTFPSARYGSYGMAWGDYDNDGYPDLFIANDGNNFDDANDAPEPNELYHNNRDGTFTRITIGAIATDSSFSTAAAWADYDNDGFLDLFVANRTYNEADPQRSFLYHNNGDGTFSRITDGPIARWVSSAGGCAWGDYDNDGFLDLFVSSPSLRHLGQNALFHNTRNSNQWLTIKCIGTVSNRSAIGAKVRVKAIIGGKTVWQLREITSGDGIGSAGLSAHYGLGDATRVESVRVEWPSGAIQELASVAPQQILTLHEPPGLLAQIVGDTLRLTLKGAAGLEYEIKDSADLTTWSTVAKATITNADGTIVLDPQPATFAARFYKATVSGGRAL